MKQKEIRIQVFDALQSGTTKSQIYDDLREKNEDEYLRKLLSSRPAPDIGSKQLKMFNWVKILWIIFLLIELFTLLDFFLDLNFGALISFIISVNLFVYIFRFHGQAFLPGMIWLGLGMVNILIEWTNTPSYSSEFGLVVIFGIVYLIISIPAIILMFKIRQQVFSYFKGFSPARNEEGEIIFE